jgi:hypothetical protein
MNHADFLDQAEETVQAFTDESVAKVRKALEPETHPDFDGESCVDCGETIIAGRLALGKVRCVYCQAILEKKSRLFTGIATHSHIGSGQPLHAKQEQVNEEPSQFAPLPEDVNAMKGEVRASNKPNKPEPKPVSKAAKKTEVQTQANTPTVLSVPQAKTSTKVEAAPVQAKQDKGTPLENKPEAAPLKTRSTEEVVTQFAVPTATSTEIEEPIPAKIARKKPEAKEVIESQKVESDVSTKEQDEQAEPTYYRDDYRRLIERMGTTILQVKGEKGFLSIVSESTWRCTLTHRATEEKNVYYYIDRHHARLARLEHTPGQNGRIG